MFRKAVEYVCDCPVTDEEYKLALDMATEDIMANRYLQGKKTNMVYVFYAVCVSAKILKRYFIPFVDKWFENEILYGSSNEEPKGIFSEVSTDAEALRTPKAGGAGEDLAPKSRRGKQ